MTHPPFFLAAGGLTAALATAAAATLGLALAVAVPAHAQDVSRDEMLRKLTGQSPAPTSVSVVDDVDEMVTRLTPVATRSIDRQRFLILAQEREKLLKQVGDLPSVDLRINFESDADVITQEGKLMLAKLGHVLHNPALKRYRFLVSAFTSPRGSSEFTQTLSDLRARAIQEHLTAGLGFPEKQVLAYGFGARVNTDVIRVVNLGNVELAAPKPTVAAKPAAKVRLQAPKKPAVATLPRKRPPVVASVTQPDVTRPAVAKPRPAPSRKVVRVAPPVQKLRYPRAPAASGQVQTRPVGVFAPRQPVTRPGYFLWGGDGSNTGGGYGGGADAGGPSGGSSPGGPSGGSGPGGSSGGSSPGGSSGGADPSGPSSGGWSQ